MKTNLFITILLLLTSNIQADVSIWTTASTHDGMFGTDAATARVAADASCSSDSNKPATHNNVHAYMSFSATDTIAQMGTNYTMPTTEKFVRSDLTTQVALNFAAMLDTNNVDLDAFVSSPQQELWTFSDSNGLFHTTRNCLNGTTNSGATTGIGGISDFLDNSYLDEGSFRCDRALSLYCVSWQTSPPPPIVETEVPTLSVWGLLLLTTLMGLLGIKSRNRKQP